MVNYKNGKIYKIVNDVNDKFYIGSTAEKYLSNRMSSHRKKDNKCMSKNIGVNLKECNIILIENYPCNDKQELRRREREYFDKYKKECKEVFLNKNRPIRLEGEDTKEKIKWVKNNKERNSKNRKEWVKNNGDKIKEYNEKNKEYKKQHYEKNKEKNKKRMKEYYEKNKEKIRKQQKEYKKLLQ